MDDFTWLSKYGPSSSIVILSLIAIVVITLKSENIVNLFNAIFKKKIVRSCGDCLLIIFGIREKYEAEINTSDKNILRSQMSYFEQKAQEITLWLIQSFQDDMDRLGKDAPLSLKIAQSGNYHEALKNAMGAVKDEVRRSFKENGFYELNDAEYSMYVKSKTRTLISIAQSYLSTYYTTNDAIVSLKYRFDKLDTSRLFDVAFDVFGNAKSVVKESIEKQEKLKSDLKKDIDNFIENKKV